MKIVVLGDTHGETLWRDILDKEDADKYVFLGDYWDSFDIPFHDQRDNYERIAALKATYPDKFILLFGNHDYHYLDEKEEYSGYQWRYASFIKQILLDDIELFQAAYQEGKYLFTHAGVTNSWIEDNIIDEGWMEIQETPLWQKINDLFNVNKEAFRFYCRDYSGYGEHVKQGPFWVRPKSLMKDPVEGVIHVVGHTQQKNLLITDNVIYADTIPNREYLVIDEYKSEIKTI